MIAPASAFLDDFDLPQLCGASGDAFSFTGVTMTDNSKPEHRKLATELDRVLSDRTQAAITDRTTLRDAVCAYVDAERLRGTPLATLIETVNEILRKAEVGAALKTDGEADRDDELARQLVTWCLEFHRRTGSMTM